MTNFEKALKEIKTPEDLAEYMISSCTHCIYADECNEHNCGVGIIKWLNQDAEEPQANEEATSKDTEDKQTKEPAPSANDASSKTNNSTSNDTTEKPICQEVQEVYEISKRWVKDMIRLADKYDKDINTFLKTHNMALYILIQTSEFNVNKTEDNQ